MVADIILALITAILSAGLTLGVGYAVLQRRWQRERVELERRLEEVRAELGLLIEERVRKGVLDAVARIPSAEVLSGTTRTAAQTGADLVSYGLSALLGRRSKPRDEP